MNAKCVSSLEQKRDILIDAFALAARVFEDTRLELTLQELETTHADRSVQPTSTRLLSEPDVLCHLSATDNQIVRVVPAWEKIVQHQLPRG